MAEGTAPAVELAAVVARELEPQLGEMCTEMFNLFSQVIPELGNDDEELRELLYSVIHVNVATGTNVFMHSIPLEQIEVPTAASHHARRLAQRQVPLEALLRAYRLGQELYLRYWFRLMRRHPPDAELLMALVSHTVTITGSYIDRVCEHVVAVYDDERKLWTRRAATTHAVQVRTALFEEDLSAASAEALTGYRMQGTHVGLVAWSSVSHGPCGVESAARVIAKASGRRPLAVLVDDRTLWAWVSGPSSVELELDVLVEELERHGSTVRIAIGGPAPDLSGFRGSHTEARGAQRVAAIRGPQAPLVTVFADVAVAAFLAKDLPAARRWVADVLGRLAVDDPGMAELRKTMMSFLRTGASLVETAKELNLHRNTVRNRLARAEDILGTPTAQARVGLGVALLACEQLGPGVLAPDAGL